VIALAAGCVVFLDNDALSELDILPNSCISVDDSAASVSRDELGFDEL